MKKLLIILVLLTPIVVYAAWNDEGTISATVLNTLEVVFNTDTSTADMDFVIDEDNMSSDSATKVPTQQSVKAYADTKQTSDADLTLWASGVNSIFDNALASAPTPTAGRLYVADGSSWDPASLGIGVKYLVIYDGSAYIPLYTEDGDTYFNQTTLKNSDDPDLTATGQISLDTGGWLRIYQDSKQKGVRLDFDESFTIPQPDDMDEDATLPLICNHSGMTMKIMTINANSDADDADFTLVEVSETDFTSTSTIEAITISTDGTSVYYYTIGAGAGTGIDDNSIANGNCIVYDASADDLQYVYVELIGYYDGDVN